MNGVTYKVKENADDAFNTVIEKFGDVVEFTPIDMLDEQRKLQKVIKEITGKLELESAKQQNILEHHPFVKEFTTEQLFTLHMYYESVSFCEALPDKIKEFEKQLADSQGEFKKIAEELKLDILPKPIEVQIDQAMEKIIAPDDGKEVA